MKKLFIVVLVLCSRMGMAAEVRFPVSDIPEELKKDADAVVRINHLTYTILSASHARVHSLYAITILNQRGNKHSNDVEVYDKLTKLTQFTASAYDANGKLIKKLKNTDFRDQSVFDGISLYSDNRLKYADLEQNVFPYTVVFEYEKEYKFLFFIDGFSVLPDEHVSSVNSTYELIFPASLEPRYKLVNIEQAPTKGKSDDGMEKLTWVFKNVKPVKFESMGRGSEGVMMRIRSAPSQFEYDGYSGTMRTWDEFGKWIASLNKDRRVLPEETKAKVRELTAGMKSTEEKTKAIYDYVQGRSRYVSIQLGIGGFQPFGADVVDRTGYGDCKALSNYTVALLAEAGVKANYVLIHAGSDNRKIDTNFPSSQFNHATVCVPNGRDTIWLECTSQTSPFGYAGTFTGDRKALAITDNGAVVVNTTTYPEAVNRKLRTAEVIVDANGNATTKVKTSYSGTLYDYSHLSSTVNGSYDDQKKWVESNTDIPSFNIKSFTMTNRKDRIPSAVVNLDLTLNRLANVSGKRLFLTPNLMSKSTFIPETLENRKTNVVIKMGHIDFDTIRYSVPDVLYPEFIPEPVVIKSLYGEYEANFKLDQGKIVYTRRLLTKKGEFPASSYNELIDFYKKIAKADNTKLVFLNKT